MVPAGSGSENAVRKKELLKRAVLWKVLAGKTNCAKKVKTPHGFPSFYSVSFRCRLLEGFSFAGRFWVGKPIYQKKIKRHMVYLFSFK